MPGQKILVIEDNRDNFRLVKFLLEREGHEIIGASDGLTGIRLAKEESPDLILLDMEIPEIDGWEAARQLKQFPSTKDIPLVALTAHTLPGDKRKALEAGCNGYIAKPIDVPNFTDQIKEYLP